MKILKIALILGTYFFFLLLIIGFSYTSSPSGLWDGFDANGVPIGGMYMDTQSFWSKVIVLGGILTFIYLTGGAVYYLYKKRKIKK